MITLEDQVFRLQQRLAQVQEQVDAISSIASQAFDRATDALNAVKHGMEPIEPPADAGEERD